MNLETQLTEALWESIRANYEKRNFTGAILDAFYFLSELLRTKSGLEGDGAALIGQALGGAAPKIKLNRLQTESELNVQRGMEQILRGLYQGIRNPRSHDKIADSEEDAQVLILFVGYLVRKLDQAKAQFSRSDFVQRVLDPDFVPQPRYAELLVSEIPQRARIDTLLELYKERENWKPENMRHFLKALFAQLGADEVGQVYDILTEELNTTESDTVARVVIGSFPSELWPRIGEAARLRIENKLIRSVRDGRYDTKKSRILGGAFGTWATTIFSEMTLKKEMLVVIGGKLWSKIEEERAFVFNYLFHSLEALSTTMPKNIEAPLLAKLRAGDSFVKTHLEFAAPWEKATWSVELQDAFTSFIPAQPTNDVDDDDIPF